MPAQPPPTDAQRVQQLEKELLYWRGVVRGARSELHEAGRISDAEYADLVQDTLARNYVERIDDFREIINLLVTKKTDAAGSYYVSQHMGGLNQELSERIDRSLGATPLPGGT